jgi:DNA/RNA-binding domain of Phe-tRNA-synthetase-like protein
MMLVTKNWSSRYPHAHVGVLALRNVTNPAFHPALEAEKRALEDRLRAQFAGQDPRALEDFGPLPAYAAYYKAFKKTYHVQGQLASVIFKGRSIPSVAALVEAMFVAELKNGLLTAGHDLELIQPPARLDAADGSEAYITLSGEPKTLKAGDMFIADQAGVISSIIYGPDQRTRISAETRSAVFTVYAPAGISAASVQAHLEDLLSLVRLFSPRAVTETREVYGA